MQTATIEKPETASEVFYPIEVQMPQGELHDALCMHFKMFLKVLFDETPDRHTGGDIFFYYEKGNPKKSFAPDAYCAKTTDKSMRDIFKLWEEPVELRFVLEVWSKTNTPLDKRQKFALYQSVLSVREYAELDTETGGFLLYRLNADGLYEEVAPTASGRFFSEELGAELVYEDGLLRLYKGGQKIPTLQEALKLSQIK